MPPDPAALIKYFVQPGDPVEAGTSRGDADKAIPPGKVPEIESGSRVTHLIDGINYFGDLRQEVAALLAGSGDRFFYANSWTLGTSATPGVVEIAEGTFTSAWKADADRTWRKQNPFMMHEALTGPFHPFKDDLVALAQAGVDVRIHVWASPFLVNFEQAAKAAGKDTLQYWGVNVHSLRSVLDLRKEPRLADKIVVNTLAHTLGSMHLKMVIMGDATGMRAYVGGIDFTDVRNAVPTHQPVRPEWTGWSKWNDWHDVMVKVEGSACNGLYRCFFELWDEQVTRSPKKFMAFGEHIPSHFDATPLTPDRTAAAISGGTCHTQVLETLPTAHFATFGNDRSPLVPDSLDIPVLRSLADCAIRAYSGFKQDKLSFAPDGRFEFRAALRKAVMAAERYIYIEDQAMENVELGGWINQRLGEAPHLKVIMVYGGDPADPASPDLPTFMEKIVAGLANPADRVAFAAASFIVHAKVTIIDDVWASVGSSNNWERSCYMDGEINVAVIDDADPPFAQRLRKDLWGEHCNKTPGAQCDPLLPLGLALGIWRDGWGVAPAGFGLDLSRLSRMDVPFVFVDPPHPKPDGWRPPDGSWGRKPTALAPVDRERQNAADSRLEY